MWRQNAASAGNASQECGVRECGVGMRRQPVRDKYGVRECGVGAASAKNSASGRKMWRQGMWRRNAASPRNAASG